MTRALKNRRIAVLAADGFEKVELTIPVAALKVAGAEVDIVSLRRGRIRGVNLHEPASRVRVTRTIEEASPGGYDALLLPGGFINPDLLRQSAAARDFVTAFDVAGKPIATLCHGPWLMASAGLLTGRTLTSWPGIRDDMVNAGAVWLDQEVVHDRNLVTSRGPQDMVPFVRAVLEHFAGAEASRPAEQHARVSSPQRDTPPAAVVNAMRFGPRSASVSRPSPLWRRCRGAPPKHEVSLEELNMRAMVYRGPGRVRVEEKDMPAIEHPNDAIVRVTCAAICGSDLHLFHGMMPDLRVGHTFGHEFVGTVHAVGSSVENLQVGDRVLVPFNICCGSCFFCARGLYSNCHNVNPNASAVGGIYGYSHTCGGYDGGQAEFVRVPFADVGPSKIPEWMEEEDAVLLTDACPTGYFGAQLGEIKEGDVVVVFGAGPVGLFAAKSAWLMGAGRVIVVDHIDYRLEFARSFAQVETINFTQVDDIVQWVKETTDFLGADVCIEAVGAEADGAFLQHVTSAKFKLQGGSPVALNWSIDAVRKGGNIGVVGAFGPLFSAVKFGDAMNKGLTIRTNQCPVKRQWPRLFEHVRNGVLKPSAIVTHRIPLDEIAEGYHLMSNKLDGCIKPLVIPTAH